MAPPGTQEHQEFMFYASLKHVLGQCLSSSVQTSVDQMLRQQGSGSTVPVSGEGLCSEIVMWVHELMRVLRPLGMVPQ